MLIEITWLGRGGQGAATAARLFAKALVYEGTWALSTIFFTAERRGAPVYAYTRVSDKPLWLYHYIKNPDVLVVFDPRLPVFPRMLQSLKENGLLVINCPEAALTEFVDLEKARWRIACCDATKIATELKLSAGGLALVNTAMLGALSKALGRPKLETLKRVFEETWGARKDVLERNIRALELGYENTKFVKG